jgi:hypothetical protein
LASNSDNSVWVGLGGRPVAPFLVRITLVQSSGKN